VRVLVGVGGCVRALVEVFRCDRPVWFRPSAIGVGFVLAQFVEQWWRTRGFVGTISGFM